VDNRNNDEPFSVKKGDRLFQLASPSLAPLTVKVVKTLPATERGENGFGSTGV
jgi:dUTP pyrophosphatase